MWARSSQLPAAALAVALAAGCTGQTPAAAPTTPPDRPAAEAPGPTAPHRSKAARNPEPKPFVVKLQTVRLLSTDNSRLFNAASPKENRAAARKAAAAATRRLRAYLNAQFVRKQTRFTRRPVDRLLGKAAGRKLTNRQRRALGVLDVKATRVRPRRRVPVTARVLMANGRPITLTLSYRARISFAASGGRAGSVIQRASILFAHRDRGWRTDAVDASLSVRRPAAKRRNRRGA